MPENKIKTNIVFYKINGNNVILTINNNMLKNKNRIFNTIL